MLSVDGPLVAPYRAIRSVRAPEDAPWPGVLARTAAGASVVLVDSRVLGPAWRGWSASTDGHILAPVDIARRGEGHDAVLPVCLERLDDFVRRRGARTPLTIGEAVTLGVSVLRGCGQVADAPTTTGDWWLDADGRPVLATDASRQGAFEAAAVVLQSVRVEARAEPAWQAAAQALTGERVNPRDLLEAEDALFAMAAPEPLATTILSPRSAAELRPHDTGAVAPEAEPPPRSLWSSLVSRVDDDVADTLSRATTAVWRRARMRRPGARRRAPWVVGGTVAAGILIGGALWPSAGGVATGDASPMTAGASPSPSPTRDEGENAGADDAPVEQAVAEESEAHAQTIGSDPAVALDALLTTRLACEDDDECLRTVVADPSSELTAGAIDLPAEERTTTLLDDFGGLAVLRVDPTAPDHAPQLVVIVLRDGEWLLRDVHDVAQQP